MPIYGIPDFGALFAAYDEQAHALWGEERRDLDPIDKLRVLSSCSLLQCSQGAMTQSNCCGATDPEPASHPDDQNKDARRFDEARPINQTIVRCQCDTSTSRAGSVALLQAFPTVTVVVLRAASTPTLTEIALSNPAGHCGHGEPPNWGCPPWPLRHCTMPTSHTQ